MTRIAKYLVAAAAVGAIASPALAQYSQPYPQGYPQGYPTQGYPQTGYGQPGYGSTNPIQGVIDQLLGNRYNVSDRTAVQQCAAAAVAQASTQYRPTAYGQGYQGQGYQQPYAQPYGGQYGQQYGQGYGQGYGNAYTSGARVTAITNVERRNNGLRVSGTLDSGRYNAYGNRGYNTTPGYNGQQGYGQQGYGNRAYNGVHDDLTFRCNVDYRGAVTNLRVRANNAFRRPY